ncbi:MAG: hypothetical protein JNJ85_11290 [Candidatus Kapabacteria bacterium]|nr:hypothetical protein [Candidatus Kapabacteria bacterium]
MIRILLIAQIVFLFNSCKNSNEGTTNPTPTRNQWDGRYRLTGTMTDSVDSKFQWKDDTYIYTMQTSSSNTDSLVSEILGFPGIIIANLANATFYSKVGLNFTFDASKNKVIGLTNYYGQPSPSGRSIVLDTTGANSVDPITKNIKVKFFVDEVGTAKHRASFDVTLIYLGDRP